MKFDSDEFTIGPGTTSCDLNVSVSSLSDIALSLPLPAAPCPGTSDSGPDDDEAHDRIRLVEILSEEDCEEHREHSHVAGGWLRGAELLRLAEILAEDDAESHSSERTAAATGAAFCPTPGQEVRIDFMEQKHPESIKDFQEKKLRLTRSNQIAYGRT